MGAQTAAIAGLVVMFIVATVLPINMGALAFALAFLVGTVSMGLRADQIIAGFPGDLFVTLVGITYLFAIAQKKGTIDFLVHSAVRMVRGRIAAIPWIMFTVAACLTAAATLTIGPLIQLCLPWFRFAP